jgi:hypothetical protein
MGGFMTENEWLESSDPEEMVIGLGEFGANDRKARLFMCACCRHVWDLFKDERCRKAVETAERFADGLATDDEMKEAQEEAEIAADDAEEMILPHFDKLALMGSANAAAFALSESMDWPLTGEANSVAEWTVYALTGSSSVDDPDREAKRLKDFDDEVRIQCDFVRDVFGNPFRPILSDPSWLSAQVVKLAQTIYDDRTFDRMPALADSLHDAGCDNDEILAHCRGPGPHVRGCWVVDLLLGKE